MRLPTGKKFVLGTAAFACLLIVIAALGYWRVNQVLRVARQAVAGEKNLRFVVRTLSPLLTDTGFEWVGAPVEIAQAAEFQGHLFIAGPAGLVEYDESGRALREFRVGRELPSSPVLRIARATLAGSPGRELVIATADAGILTFDGSEFRQILPEAQDARTITEILPLSSGHLLIGTEKRGLLVYDGRRLGPFHSSLAQIQVTELAGNDADLWVGTQNRGVAHWHGGSVDWFSEGSGLPDARVYSIAVAGDRVYVGTAAGIAEFEQDRPGRVLAPGTFVLSLLLRGDTLLAGTMDDGVLEIPLTQSRRQIRRGLPAGGGPGEVKQFLPSADSLYAVTPRGLFRRNGAADWKRVLQTPDSLLSDRNISALAADASGTLWIGYFDRGLDILPPVQRVASAPATAGQHARHIEDDQVFCINRILPDAKQGVTAVATANGLVLFDHKGDRQQVLRRSDGLISDHVTDIARHGDGLVVATPAGLTFMDSAGIRSLYAFHGLVNNHVYAVGTRGRQILAGTLGGVSLLEHDEVRTSYTTATSALKHNWITAVVPIDNEWWLGTYGKGVVRLDGSGHFEAAEGATGDLVINPNAMLATDRLLLAGTEGRGLYVMQRASGRWLPVANGLPSLNVTALSAANGYVYVGTDNGLVRIPEQRLAR